MIFVYNQSLSIKNYYYYDGLSDSGEVLTYVRSMSLSKLGSFHLDTDGDGLSDVQELYYFGDSTSSKGIGDIPATLDLDGDGISDVLEIFVGLDPYTINLKSSFTSLSSTYNNGHSFTNGDKINDLLFLLYHSHTFYVAGNIDLDVLKALFYYSDYDKDGYSDLLEINLDSLGFNPFVYDTMDINTWDTVSSRNYKTSDNITVSDSAGFLYSYHTNKDINSDGKYPSSLGVSFSTYFETLENTDYDFDGMSNIYELFKNQNPFIWTYSSGSGSSSSSSQGNSPYTRDDLANLASGYANGNVTSDGVAINDLAYELYSKSGGTDISSLSSAELNAYLNTTDYDGDGTSDALEMLLGSDPFNIESYSYTSGVDGEPIDSKYLEYTNLDNLIYAEWKDTDGDGIPDYVEDNNLEVSFVAEPSSDDTDDTDDTTTTTPDITDPSTPDYTDPDSPDYTDPDSPDITDPDITDPSSPSYPSSPSDPSDPSDPDNTDDTLVLGDGEIGLSTSKYSSRVDEFTSMLNSKFGVDEISDYLSVNAGTLNSFTITFWDGLTYTFDLAQVASDYPLFGTIRTGLFYVLALSLFFAFIRIFALW